MSQSESTDRTNPPSHNDSVVALDAIALSAAIHGRKLSCAEVMEAYLAQVQRFNPIVNALVNPRDRAQLMAEARVCDDELSHGSSRGWMHGFPSAPKDLSDVKGMITSKGSPLFKDYVSPADSIEVSRLRAAGAIFIARSNTPEFGLGAHTYNPVHGITRNAFDQRLSAAGSSGGAAVSVALRMLPVADGSDQMGSLRIPAAFNNVFSMRPSWGMVPQGPSSDVYFSQFGTCGPMARNVPDLAMLLSTQAGYDPRVPLSVRSDPKRFTQPLVRDFKGVKIGWLGNYDGYLPMDDGLLEVCEKALIHFKTIGCEVDAVQPEFSMELLWRTWRVLRSFGVAGVHASLYDQPEKRAQLKPEIVWEIEQGRKLSAMDVFEATVSRTQWHEALEKLFQRYDYLVLPSAQVFPFEATWHWPKEVGGVAMDTYHRWMEVVIGATLGSLPVVGAPAGFNAQGLPAGLQLIGRRQADFQVLQLGFAYEQASGYAKIKSPLLA